MAGRELDVLLYGATGFTGKLVARQLEARGLRFAISGRDGAKLEALRTRFGSAPPAIVCGVDDAAGLTAAARRASVVLTCAGPFARFGKPLQDAALASRSHYIDVTGEHDFMMKTWHRDEEARAAGVVLLNAAGFDVVPTDLCAYLACKGLESPSLVELALATSAGRLSQGTMKSAVGMVETGCPCFEDGRWVMEPLGHHTRHVPFPPPLGPRRVVSVPWGDVITAPRTTGARNVRVYLLTGAFGGWLVSMAGPFLPVLSRSGLMKLVERYIDSAPEGPGDSERASTRFTVWGEATEASGHKQFALVEGRDPYGLTAVTAVYFAEQMAREGYSKSGALTPCQATDPEALAEVLKGFGVSSMSPSPGHGGW